MMTQVFGSKAPFAEPPWYLNNSSTFYTASHYHLRTVVREYVDNELRDYAQEWEEKGEIPLGVSFVDFITTRVHSLY
jgi:hypothetical protein